MKKFISLLSILFLLTVFVTSKQAGADRGSGGFRGDGGHEGFRGDGGSRGDRGHGGSHGDRGRGGFRGFRGRGGFHGHGRFFPGLFIGGVLGWGLGPYYYPPDYYYPPPAEESQVPPSEGQGSEMSIYPRQGQSEEQEDEDFNKCHDWAVGQTGFDPSKPPVGAPDAKTTQKSTDYIRAISACLDARGYTLR